MQVITFPSKSLRRRESSNNLIEDLPALHSQNTFYILEDKNLRSDNPNNVYIVFEEIVSRIIYKTVSSNSSAGHRETLTRRATNNNGSLTFLEIVIIIYVTYIIHK